MKLEGAYNCVYINTWSLPGTSSQIRLETLPYSLSLSLTGINESTARFSLPERWTITEIRRQSNSALTYSMAHKCPSALKFKSPFNF